MVDFMRKAGFIFILSALLLASSIAQIQNVNISGSYNGVFMISGTSSDYKIIGSPYLSEDWMYGTLEMKSEIAGEMSSNKKERARLRAEYEAEITALHEIKGLFRYNLYAQEFEMIYDKDTFAIVAPFNIQSISISNKKFIHGFYVNRGLNHQHLGSAYFEVLNEGNCKLLMRHDVKIKSGGGPVTYNWAGSDADAFVKYKQLYYQQTNGSEVIHLKKRKKDVRKVFADKYDLVERYIRKEKINLKDEKELVKLFNYYNSLDS